jgi:hypothetical protein
MVADVQVGGAVPRDKPKKWVTARYYGMFNAARSDRWVFGDPRQRRLPHQAGLDKDRPLPAVSLAGAV